MHMDYETFAGGSGAPSSSGKGEEKTPAGASAPAKGSDARIPPLGNGHPSGGYADLGPDPEPRQPARSTQNSGW